MLSEFYYFHVKDSLVKNILNRIQLTHSLLIKIYLKEQKKKLVDVYNNVSITFKPTNILMKQSVTL